MQFVIKQFMPKNAANNGTSVPEFKPAQSGNMGTSYSQIPQVINPMWPSNVSLDVSMYISPSVVMPSLKVMPRDSLVLRTKAFKYGDYKDKRGVATTFKVPTEVQNNGTLWAHIYVAQSGSVLDPTEAGYDPTKAYRMTRPLTQYLAKKRVKKVHNLLSGKNATEAQEEDLEQKGPTVASYFHPNFTLSFIPETGSQNLSLIHI